MHRQRRSWLIPEAFESLEVGPSALHRPFVTGNSMSHPRPVDEPEPGLFL